MGDIIKGDFGNKEQGFETAHENAFEKAGIIAEYLGRITIDPTKLEREAEHILNLDTEKAGLAILESEESDWQTRPEYYFALCIRFHALTLETPPPNTPTFFPAA